MDLLDEMAALLERNSLDPVKAAFLLGRVAGSKADPQKYEKRLEEMKVEFQKRLPSEAGRSASLQILNSYLFEELGFRGNIGDYYDPRNSFLEEVLERRLGLPVTLSLIYIAVGGSAGLPLLGIGFPGHFIVKWEGSDDAVYIDPFHGGRILSKDDLERHLSDWHGSPIPLEPSHVRPVTGREILTRMLYNLKGIYMKTEEFESLVRVMDLLLLLEPQSSLDLRDRGLLSYELGDFLKARKDLQAYLELDPTAGDAEVIRVHLSDIESRLRMFR